MAADKRLADATRYLASPRLEGRGLGTHGLELAGDLHRPPVQGNRPEDRPLRRPAVRADHASRSARKSARKSTIGSNSSARRPTEKKDPQTISLKLGTDFNPLAVGGSHTFDAPAVFVGYGITAKDEKYDDYAGIDVKGKVVIVLRHQPQRSNPHGLFGKHDSPYAAFQPQGFHGRGTRRGGDRFLQRRRRNSPLGRQPATAMQTAIDELTNENDSSARSNIRRSTRSPHTSKRTSVGRPNRKPCQNGRASKSIRYWASIAPAKQTIRTDCRCCFAAARRSTR